MADQFTISVVLPGKTERIFRAWLSSEGHAAMTGSPAKVEPRVGGTFMAWDGYISGKTLELKPYTRIVQAWRTTEFPEGSPDSRVEIQLTESNGETQLKLSHTNIPEGQADSYKQGWEDFYFKPMLEYFSKSKS